MPETTLETPQISCFRDYFTRVFAYDRWANDRVLEAMQDLGERLPGRSLATDYVFYAWQEARSP